MPARMASRFAEVSVSIVDTEVEDGNVNTTDPDVPIAPSWTCAAVTTILAKV